jgi:hypothetical protein
MHARNSTNITMVAAAMLMVSFATGPASGDNMQVGVPGTANVWLSGQPNGAACCGGDVAPAESPAGPIAVSPGQQLTFSASGQVANGPNCPPGNTDQFCTLNGPDGGAFFTVTPPPGTHATNGIAGVNAPLNALIGVFLDANQPDPNTTPPSLDFQAIGTGLSSYSPGLRQPFFIGDGLTGTGGGQQQTFVVPAGATRLFLGTVDGSGWTGNQGSFAVVVSGVSGSSELTNISTRAVVQPGNNILIGGLIIQGNAAKRVLLRGRGPSLSGAPFFIPGTLPNPLLRIFFGSTLIAQNDNWQEQPVCGGVASCENAAAIAATGLDPCQPNPGVGTAPPNCIFESAILVTLPPGAYTAQLLDASGAAGVGLFEAFDIDHNTAVTLHNLSSRGVVGTGNNIMIGGFIITGTASKTVLVRGRGPSLSGAPFSIPGTLPDPFLQIFNSAGNAIAQNNNWQDPPNCFPGLACGSPGDISAKGDPCVPNPGQFFSPPNCTLESAILITLQPGAYTVQLSGAGGVTGVGLVEIFDP